MDTFRLLHVSDLHMAVRPYMVGFPDWKSLPQFPGRPSLLSPSSYDPDLTEAAARWLYRHASRYDAVLLTGDLATTGHAADLDLAHDYLFAPAAAGYWSQAHAPTLQAGGVPVGHLPGEPRPLRRPLHGPRGPAVRCRLRAERLVGRPGGADPVRPRGHGGERLAVVAADFTLASYWDSKRVFGYMGQGKVYAGILGALRQTTLRERQGPGGPVAVVWAVRFPPAFAGIDPDLALLGEQQLLGEAAALGVGHLFCGHTHEAREYRPPGQPAVHVHCAGTTAQYVTQHGNAMHETELDVAGGAVTAVRRKDVWWDQQAGDFV